MGKTAIKAQLGKKQAFEISPVYSPSSDSEVREPALDYLLCLK